MKKLPEILFKCCNKTHKPLTIKILDDCIRIIFYCPICRTWIYLESKNGMKKMLENIKPIKLPEKLPLKARKNT